MPVAEGSATTLAGLAEIHVADFVHGADGFGNTQQAAVEVRHARRGGPGPEQCCAGAAAVLLQGLKQELSAAHFIVETCRAQPGQIHVLALGPLTNLALAFQLDPQLAQNMVRPGLRTSVASRVLRPGAAGLLPVLAVPCSCVWSAGASCSYTPKPDRRARLCRRSWWCWGAPSPSTATSIPQARESLLCCLN